MKCRRYVGVRMLFVALVLLLTALPAAAADIREAIVKVYAVSNVPDYYNPWNMQGPRSSTGSGVIISEQRILTNAHVVSDNTFLQVRRYGDTERYQARILAIAHQADLALLAVDDPEFFADVHPIPFGGLPDTHTEVTVYGFPMGGDTLSITKGVVSRIEHQPYVHSSVSLLAGQIDAAINPGNSGGPVIVDNQIVGIIMQGISQAQNLGYMVPTPVIHHFLEGTSRGNYEGVPGLGLKWQFMENSDMRSYHGMAPGQSGVLVTRVVPGSPAQGRIRPNDVLLRVDRYDIANDGTVEFRANERTSLSYVVQKHQVGDTLPVSILRNGERIHIQIPLGSPLDKMWLVPNEQYETEPSYFIYGGLVFSPLTKNLLRMWGGDWHSIAPRELVGLYRDNVPEFEGQQIVVLLRVLADGVNSGYQDWRFWVVHRVNGNPIRHMADLVTFIEQNEAPYTVLENHTGQQLIVHHEKALASNERILQIYRVHADRSPDLQ